MHRVFRYMIQGIKIGTITTGPGLVGEHYAECSVVCPSSNCLPLMVGGVGPSPFSFPLPMGGGGGVVGVFVWGRPGVGGVGYAGLWGGAGPEGACSSVRVSV